jgi:hypothetical protein
MDPQAVITTIDSYLPRSLAGLYLVEIFSMLVFGIIAWVMGIIHHRKFDLYRVLRNGLGGGAAFPPSLLLILYPVSDRAQALFSAEALKAYLMVAGGTGAVLSLYGVFKK